MCERACELLVSCCGTLCKVCCRFMSSKASFLIQFLIYGIFQGFNVATDAGLFVVLLQTHQRCSNLTNGPVHCRSSLSNVTASALEKHIDTLEVLAYSVMVVLGIGVSVYIVHMIILIPNLCKHFKDPDIANEIEAKVAPRYYMNIIMTHCMFMIIETFIHDIPASCLAMEVTVHFWGKDGVNCWECTSIDSPLPEEQSMRNSSLWLGLMITFIGLLAVYKGLLPLYYWVGNPFCWSCYVLRFFVSMPAGFIYALLVLTPCMGVAALRVVPAVPYLKSEIGGTADTFWSIGLVFWVLIFMVFIAYCFCKGFIMDLCPCLAWFVEPKSKAKDEKQAGCICF